jgi:endonuclease/exonuclease/phosphatase family metal-dependent hydrolase
MLAVGIVASLAPAQLSVGSTSAPAASNVQLRTVAATAQRPQNFARQTVRAVRGVNKITVTWPARDRAAGYFVTWTPLVRNIPQTPAECVSPCRRRWTTGTSMVLNRTDLTTYGRRISSGSGNSAYLKVFARNTAGLSWTGVTYPYDAWISPSRTTNTNWVPSMAAQMPLPLPPAAGDTHTITSFNILSANASGPSWPSRAPKVVTEINQTGSSIVATQENSNTSAGVGNGKSQFQDLADRLAPSGWALADDRNWDYALGATHSASTQATRTYYKTSVWNQVARGALMTHVPINGQSSGTNVDRWVSWVKLQSKADSGTQVCVLNAHLLTNLGNYDRASADHRNREIAQILSELNNANSTVRRVGTRVGAACAGTPTVFAGDLNSAQEHAPYGNQPQATMLGNGFVDTKNAGVRRNTRYSGCGKFGEWHATWGTQIDYILTKGMGGARSFTVNAVGPSYVGSDHYPITASVNIPRRAS